MKFLYTAMGMASVASAHTLFTNFFINGKSQGDLTCVRHPAKGDKATSPISPITGDDMACGQNGEKSVPFICPAPGSSTVTFDFRWYPNYEKEGAIDPSHKGPCAVYVKKVDDILTSTGTGPGWFKIWEDTYNAETNKWCTEKLIENDGFLSVKLPSGLPSGNYLLRPELLALHSAGENDPQFYTSCAQVFIQDGPSTELSVPEEYSVSIPGYVELHTPPVTFNLYNNSDASAYVAPGPKVYYPEGSASTSDVKATQSEGTIPDNCILKAANWCATPLTTKTTDSESCWAASNECWTTSKSCWGNATIAAYSNCNTWDNYCSKLNDKCDGKDYGETPKFEGKEEVKHVPSSLPQAYNQPKGTEVHPGNGGNSNSSAAPSSAPSATSASVVASASSSDAAKATTTTASSATKPVETSTPGDNEGNAGDSPDDSAPATTTAAPTHAHQCKCRAKTKTVWQTVTISA